MLAVALLIGLNPTAQAVATPVAAVAAPSTTTSGAASLTVDPASGLSAAGGTIKVSGKGFKTTGGLYVAICHANGKAPASLADCVGGAIPNSNTSTSWAVVTADGSGGTAGSGPVVAKWASGGLFSVSLTLPASDSSSDALDCSQVVCAVYTTPSSGSDPTQNLSVPLTFAAVTTSSSTTPSSTPASSTIASSTVVSSQPIITSTLAGAPTTVEPKTIRSASIRAGGQQEVLFAGFSKNEPVSLTLDSTKLPALRADSDGIVDAKFTVPTKTTPGTHILRAIGQTSNVIGIATFQVTAIPTTSKPATSTVASSAVASSTPVSSAPATSEAAAVPTISSAPASSVASSSAAATTLVAPVTPAAGTGSSKPVWPWYVLGLVILLWIGFAVYMLQRRRSRLATEMREKDRLLAEGAAAEQNRSADAVAAANADAPTAYIGPPVDGGYTGYHPGEHGLLSGRDNPDNPGLLSGQRYRPDSTRDLPTTYLGQGVPLNPDANPAADPQGGPPTGAWRPDFTSGPPAGSPEPAGPPTGAWTPDFTSGPSATPPASAPDPDDAGPGTAQWRPPFFDDPDDDDPSAGGSGGRHSR